MLRTTVLAKSRLLLLERRSKIIRNLENNNLLSIMCTTDYSGTYNLH